MKQLPIKLFRKIVPHLVLFNGTPCWEWGGGRSKGGYGMVRSEDKMRYVHRVVYELLVSPIPEGLDLDHLCRNRACCNPAHLEPVTRLENVRRGDGSKATRNRHRSVTHCPAGHEYTPENTYNYIKDDSLCRQCKLCRGHNQRVRRNKL